MTEIGNIYEAWLGIPESEQPPNYYRLFGLEPFEADTAVIQAAIESTTQRVREHCSKSYEAVSAGQPLLMYLTEAKTCLGDPTLKAAYDAKLRGTLPTSAMPAATEPSEKTASTQPTVANPPPVAPPSPDQGRSTIPTPSTSITSAPPSGKPSEGAGSSPVDPKRTSAVGASSADDLPAAPPLPSDLPPDDSVGGTQTAGPAKPDPLDPGPTLPPNVPGGASPVATPTASNDIFGGDRTAADRTAADHPNAHTAAWSRPEPHDAGFTRSGASTDQSSPEREVEPIVTDSKTCLINLTKSEWIVGSSKQCDIVVDSIWASKAHCKIYRDGDKLMLADLGSTNGTFLNRNKIDAPQVISIVDLITLGREVRLRLPTALFPRAQRSLSTIYIGRLEGNDLQLPDPSVSSYHARVVRHNGSLFLEDLESTNGTHLESNGVYNQIEKHQIQSGDKLKVGGCVLSSSDIISAFMGEH